MTVRVLTAPGEGGIAVVSVEGPAALQALDTLSSGAASRLASDGIVRAWLVEDGRRIDEALLWRVPEGVEVGIHGGTAALSSLLRALRRGGVPVRTGPADGDTRECAAAALLPAAATLQAAMFLAAAASGAVTREIESGDPERARACRDRAAVGQALAFPRTVVIAGPPNAGKSTLLNALAGRDRSLTHADPGTTRDPVAAMVDVGGYPVRFVDTAGLGGPECGREAEAAARAAAAAADLVVWLEDPAAPCEPSGRADLRLSGKADLGRGRPGVPAVSGLTGTGLEEFRRAVVEALGLPWPADARPALFDARDR